MRRFLALFLTLILLTTPALASGTEPQLPGGALISSTAPGETAPPRLDDPVSVPPATVPQEDSEAPAADTEANGYKAADTAQPATMEELQALYNTLLAAEDPNILDIRLLEKQRIVLVLVSEENFSYHARLREIYGNLVVAVESMKFGDILENETAPDRDDLLELGPVVPGGGLSDGGEILYTGVSPSAQPWWFWVLPMAALLGLLTFMMALGRRRTTQGLQTTAGVVSRGTPPSRREVAQAVRMAQAVPDEAVHQALLEKIVRLQGE